MGPVRIADDNKSLSQCFLSSVRIDAGCFGRVSLPTQQLHRTSWPCWPPLTQYWHEYLVDEMVARPKEKTCPKNLVPFELQMKISKTDMVFNLRKVHHSFRRPFGPYAVWYMRNGRYYYYKQFSADHYFLLSETQTNKKKSFSQNNRTWSLNFRKLIII